VPQEGGRAERGGPTPLRPTRHEMCSWAPPCRPGASAGKASEQVLVLAGHVRLGAGPAAYRPGTMWPSPAWPQNCTPEPTRRMLSGAVGSYSTSEADHMQNARPAPSAQQSASAEHSSKRCEHVLALPDAACQGVAVLAGAAVAAAVDTTPAAVSGLTGSAPARWPEAADSMAAAETEAAPATAAAPGAGCAGAALGGGVSCGTATASAAGCVPASGCTAAASTAAGTAPFGDGVGVVVGAWVVTEGGGVAFALAAAAVTAAAGRCCRLRRAPAAACCSASGRAAAGARASSAQQSSAASERAQRASVELIAPGRSRACLRHRPGVFSQENKIVWAAVEPRSHVSVADWRAAQSNPRQNRSAGPCEPVRLGRRLCSALLQASQGCARATSPAQGALQCSTTADALVAGRAALPATARV